MSNLGEEDRGFIQCLYRLAPSPTDDRQTQSRKRAAWAKLRRGLGKAPGEAVDMLEVIANEIPRGDTKDRRRLEAYFEVASLFGLHPMPTRGSQGIWNMGSVCRRVRPTDTADSDRKTDSADRRFLTLLDARWEQLSPLLRQVVDMAKEKGVPVPYRRLLYDLKSWDNEERTVQLEWAMEYWKIEKPDSAADTSDGAAGEDLGAQEEIEE